MKRTNRPSFKFCGYCGAKDSVVEADTNFSWLACIKCFAGYIQAYSPTQVVKYDADWAVKWKEGGYRQFIKRLYQETTDEETKRKITAELLAGNNNDQAH